MACSSNRLIIPLTRGWVQGPPLKIVACFGVYNLMIIQLLNSAIEIYHSLFNYPIYSLLIKSRYFTLPRQIIVNQLSSTAEICFIEAACNYSLNWVLFCLRICSLCFLFCLFVRWFVLSQTASLTLRRRYHDFTAHSFRFCFVLEQMRLQPFIPSVLAGISFSVPGIDIPMIEMKREA